MKRRIPALIVKFEKSILISLLFGLIITIMPACSQKSAEDRSGDVVSDSNEHEEMKDSFFRLREQTVSVEDFESKGYILDIGGGGEGVIGRLKGEQVISIDISKRELEAAPEGPLKIIMDARDLQFLDGTFNTSTSFFTLMYIDGSDHEQVFREIHRVLASGGKFYIWDVLFPKRTDKDIEIAVVPLRVRLPGEEFQTAYGGSWPDEGRDLEYYVKMAERTQFEVVSQSENDLIFYLELRKP
ncbi:MAG: class I SAM-dependent methyltransferase [Candidatus Glassbacteria bacterium]